ncbi:uncharacterized protein LOC113209243 [Frankliniella occidentalis]|uniref:Uncharacterized protein LOC113209243 n=1 Tax=Frankliniella occidentalis TaxID=133901 RepID=A0A6J1SSZ5_FRAOC|nr:uncharacterized protein LOC113209243 [Frankliniella occidentalis]
MSVKVIALVLVLGAVVSEQRVLIVEVPPSERLPSPAAPGPGARLDDGEHGLDREAAPGPATAQLTVPSGDVEALTRFLRFHYRRYLLRLFPLEHVDGDAYGDNQCDPDECYSHCYLQGFRSGKCKENKCFCTQAPPSSTTTVAPPPLR